MSRRKTKQRARVPIVDDHPAVREDSALRLGRQPDLEVCGEAADTNEALHLVAETRPDVAVLDISLKTGNGIDLIKRIKAREDHVRILVWSMHNESLYAERALHAGALGYIAKDQATDRIVEAIRRVLAGKVWLSVGMAERVLQRARRHRPRRSQAFAGGRSGGSRAGGIPSDRRGHENRGDRRTTAPERQDGRDLPGPHPAETGP
jgi:DNA-binding NarL/FixJ family response regulator